MKTFGQPGSITPASFRPDLHLTMINEGLLLLREMGLNRKEMSTASGLSVRTISGTLNLAQKPFAIKNITACNMEDD